MPLARASDRGPTGVGGLAGIELWTFEDPMRAVLLTAGATRNPIDAMRYISAFSTGTTGVWLARALVEAGRRVHLLGSAEALLRAPELSGEEFTSTRDLMARMQRWTTENPGGVVVHAAAVGDYEAQTLAGKLSSGMPELTLRLTPTPKIVDHLKGWDPTLRLVSFKAAPPETDDEALLGIARRQLTRTGSELVFANVLGRLGSGVMLVYADREERLARRQEGLDALLAAILTMSEL